MPPWDGDVTPASDDCPPTVNAPRFGDWLWRPWYAKLWWTLIVLYWLGAFAAQWFPNLQPIFHGDGFPVIFLVLHPFAAIPVLGFGFARAWVAYHSSLQPGREDDAEVEYSPSGLRLRTVKFSLLNPFDPISVANPANPANPTHPIHRH